MSFLGSLPSKLKYLFNTLLLSSGTTAVRFPSATSARNSQRTPTVDYLTQFWLLSSSFYVKGPFLNLRRANAIIASKNVTTDQCYVKELYSFILQLINTLLGLTRPNNSL